MMRNSLGLSPSRSVSPRQMTPQCSLLRITYGLNLSQLIIYSFQPQHLTVKISDARPPCTRQFTWLCAVPGEPRLFFWARFQIIPHCNAQLCAVRTLATTFVCNAYRYLPCCKRMHLHTEVKH